MSQLPADDLGRAWAARRGERAVLHVDTAACGRTSDAVRARIADHLLAESRHGGYVAERAAEEELLLSRLQLGNLLGFAGEEIAFVESASNAIAQLIDAWPLRPGNRIWAVRSEWGPNLAAFAGAARHRRLPVAIEPARGHHRRGHRDDRQESLRPRLTLPMRVPGTELLCATLPLLQSGIREHYTHLNITNPLLETAAPERAAVRAAAAEVLVEGAVFEL